MLWNPFRVHGGRVFYHPGYAALRLRPGVTIIKPFQGFGGMVHHVHPPGWLHSLRYPGLLLFNPFRVVAVWFLLLKIYGKSTEKDFSSLYKRCTGSPMTLK